MRKLIFILSLVLLSAGILSACGSTDSTDTSFKVGMVTDLNGIDDKAFNQSAWEGLSKFGKEANLVKDDGYRYIQSSSDSDYIPNLTKFADANYPLIFGIGSFLDKAVNSAAQQYPNQHFVIVDNVVNQKNVTSVTFKEEEGSFLAGVAAALSTKTNKVGFIGGMNIDLIQKFEYGFKAGVKAVNPNIEIITGYAGSFKNPEKGAQLASSMYGQNVDIIYTAAGGTGSGVFTEAKNAKKKGKSVWVIGVDRDQYEEGMPENVTLTSMIKKVDVAVYDVAKRAKEGTYSDGQNLVYGLKEGGIQLSERTDNLNQEVLMQIEAYKQKIINGEIIVPKTK
ncbi:BMP family lipoprotein [Ectobacillus antri]|uniref:BMP family lipoprotein n=1 Tax=Ectobacillus antri TaxID=2486280 RepID=UPI000F5B762C|nr:BMP family ABC transporter substrate-binding protein [Ectobacillus antri]